MELYKDLELVDVIKDDEKVTLMFVDSDKNEVHDVTWRTMVFDQAEKKYKKDDNKLKKVEDWSQKYLGVPLSEIESAVGQTHDIYSYDNYESLWESDKRFDSDMVGQIISSKFKEIEVADEGIIMRFEYDGSTYRSNMKFTVFEFGKYMIKPLKRNRQLRKFEDNFGVPVDRADELIGKDILVEIKSMGNNVYAEIKPFAKKKK